MNIQKQWITILCVAIVGSHLTSCRASPMPPTPVMPSDVHALAALLQSPDPQTKLRAIDALEDMGPAAAPAIPNLIKALSDVREVRGGAADVLASIGSAAAPATGALTILLNDEWAGNRAAAARALGSIGPEAREATAALGLALTSDKDAAVRTFSAEALGTIGDPAALDNLSTALGADPEATVRRAAALAIAYIGAQARTAVPELEKALTDEEIGVRAASAYAIARITGQPFPDSSGTGKGYRIGEDGEALIVIAAREWWETEGQYENWSRVP